MPAEIRRHAYAVYPLPDILRIRGIRSLVNEGGEDKLMSRGSLLQNRRNPERKDLSPAALLNLIAQAMDGFAKQPPVISKSSILNIR